MCRPDPLLGLDWAYCGVVRGPPCGGPLRVQGRVVDVLSARRVLLCSFSKKQKIFKSLGVQGGVHKA